MEVAETPADVVPEDLPDLVLHLDAVLVLEEGDGLLRPLPISPAAGEPPLLAHAPHGVLDQALLGQLLARMERPEHELHRRVDRAPRPALPARQLLQDVEAPDVRRSAAIPAAPGAVVVVVVAATAVLEHARAGPRPGEEVGEIRHRPEHSTGLPRLDRARGLLVPRQAPDRPRPRPTRDPRSRRLRGDAPGTRAARPLAWLGPEPPCPVLSSASASSTARPSSRGPPRRRSSQPTAPTSSSWSRSKGTPSGATRRRCPASPATFSASIAASGAWPST